MEYNLTDASIYTEFSGINKLKLAARNSSPEALNEVAEQFEAFFLNLMLKQMRDANLADGVFDSDQSRFYQDMMDQQLALTLAKKRTVGIAESIVRQLKHTVKDAEKTEKTEKTEGLKPLPERKNFDRLALKLTTDIDLQPSRFKTPTDFIETMRPYAKEAADKLGIPASVLLAQSALETGWGQKVMRHQDGKSSHNLFGIKADERWSGDKVKVASLEYRDGKAKREVSEFRVYNSFKESFDDYVNFIKSNDRYHSALKNSNNGGSYIKALQDAGYATDPEYANKVISIINREAI